MHAKLDHHDHLGHGRELIGGFLFHGNGRASLNALNVPVTLEAQVTTTPAQSVA